MLTNNYSITLIIPCYNEVLNLQKGVLDKVGKFVQKDKRFLEVVIVDDGSTDDSQTLIEGYIKIYPKFKLIRNNHQGKAFAIITGITKAKGEQVMFSDIDLATPIEEANKLIKELVNDYDIIIGSRSSARAGAPLTRKIMAYGLITLRGLFLGLGNLKDTQCGFKLFDRGAAKKIISKLQVFKNGKSINGSSVSAGFDLEFLFVGRKLGYKIKEVPVSWKHVETKNVNFLNDSIETLMDMWKIRFADINKSYE